MGKNKFRYTVDHWVNIGADRFPEGLIKKLHGLETYKDLIDTNEHLYNAGGILDKSEHNDNETDFAKEHIAFLEYINEIQTKEDAAYFRIVYS
jgi:hypothetical protein